MLKKAALAVVLLLSAFPALAADYQAGQIWSYRTRPGEEASRLYIVRIDRELSTRPIFHIYLDGLALKNALMEGGVQKTLPYAAVSQETLDASVVELLASDAPMPNIGEGYSEWRLAFGRGQTGVFTLPVKDVVQYIEDAFARQGAPRQ
ncbi:hypothetical protein [Pelagibius sp. 7325]|uniref:hypothetical protein n=1 Tax=Pelagibius sp. 7325 TaxID=3131994 RepID=UPI0030EBA1EE